MQNEMKVMEELLYPRKGVMTDLMTHVQRKTSGAEPSNMDEFDALPLFLKGKCSPKTIEFRQQIFLIKKKNYLIGYLR